jgi:hypothetical protein
MAATRRGGRHPGRSDPIDAEAVALAALGHLPVIDELAARLAGMEGRWRGWPAGCWPAAGS